MATWAISSHQRPLAPPAFRVKPSIPQPFLHYKREQVWNDERWDENEARRLTPGIACITCMIAQTGHTWSRRWCNKLRGACREEEGKGNGITLPATLLSFKGTKTCSRKFPDVRNYAVGQVCLLLAGSILPSQKSFPSGKHVSLWIMHRASCSEKKSISPSTFFKPKKKTQHRLHTIGVGGARNGPCAPI